MRRAYGIHSEMSCSSISNFYFETFFIDCGLFNLVNVACIRSDLTSCCSTSFLNSKVFCVIIMLLSTGFDFFF